MQFQIQNYEETRKKYENINDKFKKLNNLSLNEKKELLREISELNSIIKNNTDIGKKLEKDMNIILYNPDGTYNGNRFKIMAYWLRREEMNQEILKLRDDNLAIIELMNQPKMRKRLKKTEEAIENLRSAGIEENSGNIKLRKFYLDIIEIYEKSIAIAKERKISYSGMLIGMEEAIKFNDFIVSQIDLSLAGLMSKEVAKIIYEHRKLFKNKREYNIDEINEIEKMKSEIENKILELSSIIKRNNEIKERSLILFKQIASGDRKVPLEIVKEASEKWKKFIPSAKELEEKIKIEIEGLQLAYSALDRLKRSV